MKLKWQQSPVKTKWGDDMVEASVAIDNDHTLSLYCERDQAPKVEAMFAQRTWVGLTDELDVKRLNHCMIAVRDWLGGGCDINDIPRPEIAALVAFTDYGIKGDT